MNSHRLKQSIHSNKSMMTHGSLFSGIGGFDLAAEWMGWENLFHCELEDFPRKILNYHFPKSISYGDIKETDFTIWRGKIDILTGGFPCQPYSSAGLRKGKEDERHLWPEMLRAVREIQPRWVVGENVRGLVSWNDGLVFEEVQFDLETERYEVQPFLLPAACVNAPHKRDRVWFVAKNTMCSRCLHRENEQKGVQVRQQRDISPRDSIGVRGEEMAKSATNTASDGRRQDNRQRKSRFINQKGKNNYWENFPTQPPICGRDDGIPQELDSITFSKWRKESIKAYGNAIVPQVALQIFKAIQQYENNNK